MAVSTPIADIGWRAEPFRLKGVDGRWHTLKELSGPRGTVVMFICNHCPYVKAVRHRIVRDCLELKNYGINAVAIMSNDPTDYPEDSWETMKAIAQELQFSFPYLLDEKQEAARSYGAVCTPDFFGFNNRFELQYRGRLDESRKETAPPDVQRELFNAMVMIAKTGKGPHIQTPSIGCSIKWGAE